MVDAIYRRNYDAAIRACKDALQLDPNNALAWTRLGSAYFASGDKTNAANAYKNALKLNPEDSKLRQFVTQQGLE